jgi:CheY-like chemotaxis protein
MMGHQHSVLLAEDDSDTRESLVAFLEHAGSNVLAVSHGRDALAALRGGFRPCVILLDLAMPDMDGWQFRRTQLADPPSPQSR